MPTTPIQGAVADWIGRQTGDHCGNYFDLVSQSYANVIRATPKTIYDPLTGRIYDVPAGCLAVNPWGAYQANGVGFAPVIEEARTNYLVNSYGAANAAGIWTTGWSLSENVTGSPAVSIVPGVYGSTAQRIVWTGVAESTKYIAFTGKAAVGTFAAGEAATGSLWLKGSSAGVTVAVRVGAYTAAGGYLGIATQNVTLTGAWQRIERAYTSLPATTSYCTLDVYASSIDEGDTFDITISAAQLEKGAFATSYIPTTTAAATRNADVVAGLTTGLVAATGSIIAVGCGDTGTGTKPQANIAFETSSARLAIVNVTPTATAGTDGSATAGNVTAGVCRVLAMTWKANELIAYKDGTAGTADTTVTPPSGAATAILIGSDGTNYRNGALQRVAVMPTTETAATVATYNTLVNGANAGGMSPAMKMLLLTGGK